MVQAGENVFRERVNLVEIITNTTEFELKRETAAAIGKFDGIHIGHRKLIEKILACKRDGLAACVFTFDPSPAVFFGKSDAFMLTTKEEKRLLFEQMGVDILIEYPMNRETAATPPEVFAGEVLAKRMKVKFLAAGSDLSFGAKGAGNAVLLEKLGPELGFSVETIDKVCVGGEVVSSTLVREQVEKGNMEKATELLGMPYLFSGRVLHGNRIGRTLGFPTVNLLPDGGKLLPPCGVYFSEVCSRGKYYRAISNVGYKPTIAGEKMIGVESYLYDFDEVVYDEEIQVYLHRFYRPERRFESLEALREQLKSDIAEGRNYKLSENNCKV